MADTPVADERARVGDRVPAVLTREDLAHWTGYSLTQIDAFRRAHSHPGIEPLEGPGQPRFRGAALQRWLDNRREDESERRWTFGKARRR